MLQVLTQDPFKSDHILKWILEFKDEVFSCSVVFMFSSFTPLSLCLLSLCLFLLFLRIQ